MTPLTILMSKLPLYAYFLKLSSFCTFVHTALKINRLSSVDKSALCVHPACTVRTSGGESALVAVPRAACLCTHSLFRGVPLRIFCIGGASKRLLRQKFLPPVSVFPRSLYGGYCLIWVFEPCSNNFLPSAGSADGL